MWILPTKLLVVPLKKTASEITAEYSKMHGTQLSWQDARVKKDRQKQMVGHGTLTIPPAKGCRSD